MHTFYAQKTMLSDWCWLEASTFTCRPAGVQKLEAEVYKVSRESRQQRLLQSTSIGTSGDQLRTSLLDRARLARSRSVDGSRVASRQTTHARASLFRLSSGPACPRSAAFCRKFSEAACSSGPPPPSNYSLGFRGRPERSLALADGSPRASMRHVLM